VKVLAVPSRPMCVPNFFQTGLAVSEIKRGTDRETDRKHRPLLISSMGAKKGFALWVVASHVFYTRSPHHAITSPSLLAEMSCIRITRLNLVLGHVR
jgi:hypothetical protein